tara:strand:+ start:1873 stop:2712 length:840 start_codon:yes stop_codon:yes gene_type:complete
MRFLYPLAKRFIAGHTLESAKPVINKLIEDGYEVSVDYVGEESKNSLDCYKAKHQYIRIINSFSNEKIDISIKPSQLGVHINPKMAIGLMAFIAKLANKKGHTIRLDMEDSRVTDITIDLAILLNKRFGNVGVAIQANLLRTAVDLQKLIKSNISVRLVKGAYKESEKIAYQHYFDISGCFYNYAASLYANKANKPAIATHDEELLEDIEELIPNPKFFDYEFLYGIRRDLQENYKNKGHKVRIYVPFGENWLPYTLRRLKEWKNLAFVIKNIVKEWCK